MDTLLDLSYLGDNERRAVVSVLQRDDRIKKNDQQRIIDLKRELNDIRMKSVIKPGENPSYMCARCRAKLGIIFDRGEICPNCRNKVCSKCKNNIPIEKRWLCIYCLKQRELEMLTGDWFYMKLQRRHSKRKRLVSGPDLVKASLVRRSSRRNSRQSLTRDQMAATVEECASEDQNQDKPLLESAYRQPSWALSDNNHSDHQSPNVSYPTESDQREKVEVWGGVSSEAPLYDINHADDHDTVDYAEARDHLRKVLKAQESEIDLAGIAEADWEPERDYEAEFEALANELTQAESEHGSESLLSGSHPESTISCVSHLESGYGSGPPDSDDVANNRQHNDSVPFINVTAAEDSTDHTDDIDKAVESHKANSNSLLATSHSHGSNPPSRPGSSLGSRESVYSFYSDAGEGLYGSIPVQGEILLSLDFNYKTNVFIINVKQCRSLAIVDDKRRRTDPYVKGYLLPDKTRNGKRKTRVKKHTTNPVYDEQLKYNVTKSELESRTLWISVWHNDRLGRNAFLGEVTINMDYYEFKDSTPQWYHLEERKHPPMSYLAYKGDLILAIKYVTSDSLNITDVSQVDSQGELHVNVKAAKNLTSVRANGTSDPFCKGYLLPDKKRNSKQKTPVVKHNCNPEWNILMKFDDVSIDELKDKCLELTIWDYDRIGSNQFLGGARLNLGTGFSGEDQVDWMDARTEEISMWQEMLSSPNQWIDTSLSLRPNMDRQT